MGAVDASSHAIHGTACGELRVHDDMNIAPIRHSRSWTIHGYLARASLWLAVGSAALLIVYCGALAAARPLLSLHTPVTPVDVVVVLGGDGTPRASKAAAVYRSIAAAAPRVLVTGADDCLEIAKLMIDHGVPPERILIECSSHNTWENAKLSKSMLEEMGVHSAILVTSWFHMRRAIGCFEAFSPEIRWGAAPVERRRALFEVARDMEGVAALMEYLKVAWYAGRYGVVGPFSWDRS